ncbi:MAG: hypothetical protein IKQ28_00340, partial [Lachnospiraceae bacterium]|nr:hypothetical protein [Lachnospiraceae bacterium]
EGMLSSVIFSDASVYYEIRGDYITAIGSLRGGTDYNQQRATLRVSGSGSHALAYGGMSTDTKIYIADSDTAIDLMTACQKDTNCLPENMIIKHGKNKFLVNGYPYEHYVDYGELKQ